MTTSPEGSLAAPKQGGMFEDPIEVLMRRRRCFDRTRAIKAGKYALVTAIVAAIVVVATKNLLQPWFDAQADLTIKMAAAKGRPMPEAMTSGIRASTAGVSCLLLGAVGDADRTVSQCDPDPGLVPS
ncbi:MAG: hypothetical protein IPP90_20930 [Gemmatimonadaceae bacterium]|nr:hypothetical protein [Gemmatimonadaceae bacterium]